MPAKGFCYRSKRMPPTVAAINTIAPRIYLFRENHDCEGSSAALNTKVGAEGSAAFGAAAETVSGAVLSTAGVAGGGKTTGATTSLESFATAGNASTFEPRPPPAHLAVPWPSPTQSPSDARPAPKLVPKLASDRAPKLRPSAPPPAVEFSTAHATSFLRTPHKARAPPKPENRKPRTSSDSATWAERCCGPSRKLSRRRRWYRAQPTRTAVSSQPSGAQASRSSVPQREQSEPAPALRPEVDSAEPLEPSPPALRSPVTPPGAASTFRTGSSTSRMSSSTTSDATTITTATTSAATGCGTLGRPRQFDGSLHHLAQPLQRREIALSEGMRLPREQLEDPQHLIVIHHRHHDHRGDSQLLANFCDSPARRAPRRHNAEPGALRTLSPESPNSVESSAPSSGAFDPVLARHSMSFFPLPAQGNRRSIRSRDVLGSRCQQLQGGMEIPVCHLARDCPPSSGGNSIGEPFPPEPPPLLRQGPPTRSSANSGFCLAALSAPFRRAFRSQERARSPAMPDRDSNNFP